jgi:Family of unknown function (DUF5407)
MEEKIMADDAKKIEFSFLMDMIQKSADRVVTQLEEIEGNEDALQIGDLFKMQFAMNHLNQATEAATNVMAAMHSANMANLRNIKT